MTRPLGLALAVCVLGLVPAASSAPLGVPRFGHALVVVFENKERDEIAGNSDAATFAALATQYATTLSQLRPDLAAGRLPSFALVVPNLCNDMHDCSIATGDRWLRKNIVPLLAEPQLAESVVFVVFDEGSTNVGGGGHVAALALGPLVKPGSRFDHGVCDGQIGRRNRCPTWHHTSERGSARLHQVSLRVSSTARIATVRHANSAKRAHESPVNSLDRDSPPHLLDHQNPHGGMFMAGDEAGGDGGSSHRRFISVCCTLFMEAGVIRARGCRALGPNTTTSRS